MANPTDQDKEANPIAEIFDEVFTLVEDLETRSVAIFEYMKEQAGVTDERLAPYLDRAAAASDVRWRAARARMEHLLAPKPKSATDVEGDKKAKEKNAESSGTKPQGEKKQEPKADSKDLGKELASPQPGEKSPEPKDAKSQDAKPAAEGKPKEVEQSNKNGEQKQTSGKSSSSSEAEEQASALAGDKKPEPKGDENAKTQKPQSAAGKSSSQSSGEEKQHTQKASK